jgi:hypothetical protein
MDEGTATAVDQPVAIVTEKKVCRKQRAKFLPVVFLDHVIMVHSNTSQYMKKNEVE